MTESFATNAKNPGLKAAIGNKTKSPATTKYVILELTG